jgi:hypothetical protein
MITSVPTPSTPTVTRAAPRFSGGDTRPTERARLTAPTLGAFPGLEQRLCRETLSQRLVPSCQPALVNSVAGRSLRAPSMTTSTRSLKKEIRSITTLASLSGAS